MENDHGSTDGSGPDAALAGQDPRCADGTADVRPWHEPANDQRGARRRHEFENNESFVVNLTSPGQPAVVLTDAQSAGNIVNDDVPPSVSINDVTVAEGNAGTSTASFTSR